MTRNNMSSALFLTCFILVTTLGELRSFSLLLLLITIFVVLSITVRSNISHNSLLFSLLLSLSLLSCIFFVTCSILCFFIIFEFRLAPITFLIFIFGYQPEKLSASTYLLVYTVLGSLPLFWYIVQHPGFLWSSFSALTPMTSLFVTVSFIVKSPLYTLHTWLPKAHTEAPLLGSMLLSGILLKFGGYGILVLAPSLLGSTNIYIYLSILGGLICSVLCFRCWDMKSLVAYSSIVHIGAVTLGCLRGLEIGVCLALCAILSHSLVSPVLFLIAYEIYLSTTSRSFIVMHRISITSSYLLVVAAFSGLNLGLPPSLGFWVELALVEALGSIWYSRLFPLVLVSYFAFVFSLFLYLRSCGGPLGAYSLTNTNLYPYLPSFVYSLILPLAACY